jgi:hypothetical protein
MAKITQQVVLDVPKWANDHYKQVMAQKARERAQNRAKINRIKNTLDVIAIAIMTVISIMFVILWLKQGYVIKW